MGCYDPVIAFLEIVCYQKQTVARMRVVYEQKWNKFLLELLFHIPKLNTVLWKCFNHINTLYKRKSSQVMQDISRIRSCILQWMCALDRMHASYLIFLCKSALSRDARFSMNAKMHENAIQKHLKFPF